MKIFLTEIIWDTDGEEVELPTQLEIDTAAEGIEDIETGVADWLADRYGWCVTGYTQELAPELQQPAL